MRASSASRRGITRPDSPPPTSGATWTSCPSAISTRCASSRRAGQWAPDAVIVHCSPPDRAGYLSLGVSMSYLLSAARRAPCVIAQVNPRMPRTLGNAFLHRSQIDCWAEAEHALVEYPPTPVGEIERTIARHVAELVPDGATVQVGVGSIPQAVMEALPGKRDLGVHSLLVDHMLPLIESGVITNSRKRLHPGRMDVGEIMGTERLFRWVHDNPMVNMEPSDIVHDPQVVGALGDFVSVNSALEVDLLGQVNAESVDGRQITGIGGQFDFVLGASRAAGGRSIIALPSTGRQGKVSRIAARLPSGARVTTPRFIADYVVTEYGTAALAGQSDAGRARALARIAHPAFREASGAGGRYVLSLSISAKTSGSSGNRYVIWLSQTRLPSISTKKMPPDPSFRAALMPYLALMAACKLEAWGRKFHSPQYVIRMSMRSSFARDVDRAGP